MGKESGLKQFVTSIQTKISIAVAIVIIRNKPLNQTLEEYASSVQEQFLKLWQNQKNGTDFESRIIGLQQAKILKQLQSILPEVPNPCVSDLIFSEDNFPSVCKDLDLPVPADSQDSDSESESELNNAEFIHAMIRLKFAVDTRKSLSLSNVHFLTRNVLQQLPSSQWGKTEPQAICYSQDDSGFNSCKTNNGSEDHTVSSCLFRSVTHSSDTEMLLAKSVDSVLKYVHTQITNKPEESFNQWQGSVLEHMCSILQEASIESICTEYITSFVRKILDEIWTSTDLDKHVIWEYQCCMLTKLCCNTNILTDILDYLVEKLNELTSHIESLTLDSIESTDTYLIEKSPHFIQMTLNLLKKLKHYSKKPIAVTKVGEEECQNVTNLWKSKWESSIFSETEDSSTNCHIDGWKECFEKLISVSSKDFSLISFQVWELMKILETFSTENIEVCR